LLGDGFEEDERLRSSIDVHIEQIKLKNEESEEGQKYTQQWSR